MKDLNEVIVEPHVRPNDFHYTKFVTTVVCVVPVTGVDQFRQNYWRISNYVIPESERRLKVPEKDGLSLW